LLRHIISLLASLYNCPLWAIFIKYIHDTNSKDIIMGGHSHWAGIKHKKAVVDAKRGKVFTKIIREITIAAKLGGGDIEGNPRLRKAVDDAKNANMPGDNVKRAIMKGTGQIPGTIFEELTYEGYGPGGIAVLVETTTDNKNRTFSEIRKIFDTRGGNIGASGCVAWIFEQKGYIVVKKEGANEEELMNLAIDSGAQDFKIPENGDYYEIITDAQNLEEIANKIKEKFSVESAEVTKIPTNEVKVGEDKASQVIGLMEALEEHDDVKNVYSNYDIPDDILQKLEQSS
jgi:YebC/PmpR family DNA-binding regulatory protein